MIHMIYMMTTQDRILTFKSNPFEFQELVTVTGLTPSSVRNLLSKLISEGIILSDISQKDKRKRSYQLNWKYIVKRLKACEADFMTIIEGLELDAWEGKYVAMRDFEVIDADDSLETLTKRFWDKLPSSSLVIVPALNAKDVFTLEFA